MSAAKHTPGPWSMDEDTCAVSGRGGYAKAPVCDAMVSADDVTNAANARLIAAAPELLAALAQLLTEVDDMTKRTGWAGNGGRDMARAALAKVQP